MTQSGKWTLGVIGGSGLYELDGLSNGRWERVASPWGEPSDDLFRGEIDGVELVFLPRHGRGHRISPSHLNYRANIDVLKRAGATDILSLSAVGSLREDFRPGDFVMVDQFVDRSFAREKSFFGEGVVAHVSMAEPVCGRLGAMAADAAEQAGKTVHRGGVYLVMEGPQFSTRAESKIYRSWGVDVIGMTNLQEARLAREAELCYATVAMSTDYDCWHDGHDDVTVEGILEVMHTNVGHAKDVLRKVVPTLGGARGCGCGEALQHAIMTAPDRIGPEARDRLGLLLEKYL